MADESWHFYQMVSPLMMKGSSEKIRIAMIVPGGIGTGTGNIGVPVMERIFQLLSADFDITVFSLFPVNTGYRSDHFRIVSVPSRNRLLKTIQFFFAFRRIHRKKRFRVVHGFWALPSGMLAVIAARLYGMKSVVSVLGGDTVALPAINYGHMRGFLTGRLTLMTLARAGIVMSVTQHLVNNLRQFGFRRDDVRIIPWGVDIDRFKYIPKSAGIPVRCLHIANLSPVKDQITLLKAFKILSGSIPATLTIIGEGVSESKLLKAVEELQLTNLVSLGRARLYDQIYDAYRDADLLIQTSLSEGQAMVVAEAMSSGVVVASTAVGMAYDVSDSCISVPAGDYEGLAEEIISVLQDPGRFRLLQEKGRAWAVAHTEQWTVHKMADVYIKLCGV